MRNLEDIRESLIDQLQSKGANVAHFEAQVDRYINLECMCRECESLIKEKGITYEAVSSTGKVYEKDNPSAKLLPQYIRSQLQILKDMGLTTSTVGAGDDEEL